MEKYFVISGSYEEAKSWIERNGERLNREQLYPIFLSGIEKLRGVSEPRGVFIGEWYKRSDAIDIIQQLILSTNDSAKKQLYVDLVKEKLSQKDR